VATYVIKLPDVGEGIAEAEIVDWHVSVGDEIEEDDVLVDVMTDKATVELPSPVSGTVAWLGGEVGDVMPIGAELIRIDVDGQGDGELAAAPAALRTVEQAESESPPAPVPSAVPAATTASTAPALAIPTANRQAESHTNGQKPLASPAVRRRARALDVDLGGVAGNGPEGRIEHEDLDAFLASARGARPVPSPPPPSSPAPVPVDEDVIDDIKVVGLRRNIAQRMQLSKRKIPHFTYVEEIDVSELEIARATLNQNWADQRPSLTILPFLVRAVVVAIRDFPQMNARFNDDDGVVQRHRSVHLGIAAQTSKGLMVPVLKNAQARDLWDSATEIARLSAAARAGTVTLAELTGSTITITSLGALGGIVSTPVINYPEVAVIGVNKIMVRPVYSDGGFVPRNLMNLSSSFDHRVIDGWDAAQFVQRIKVLLETPALLFTATS
jgi:2-oxoisovalerate dehydrogenase E2 component (dihydrolipoyl transacylase)